MPALNNVTTTDNYSQANTLVFKGTKLTLYVNNAAIFYQATDWDFNIQQEVFLIPGAYPLSRNVRSCAVRSGAAGIPAQVTIEIV